MPSGEVYKMRELCIFEDGGYKKLLPLVYMRPVYELRCGIDLLLDKIVRSYPGSKVGFYCREYLRESLLERYRYPVNKTNNMDCLFINGRVLLDEGIPLDGGEEIGVKDGTVIYARLNRENVKIMTPSLCLTDDLMDYLKKIKVKIVDFNARIIDYPWDLISQNSVQIERDFKAITIPAKIEGEVYDGVCLLNKSQIHIGRGSKVKPCTILDAENGPIYIGEGVKVFPNVTIEGPAFIGDKSQIKIGAKIYEGTSIGEVCKVGGEVEGSILHSFSNKQHDGFLGHSYICTWCNIGAGTSNSDLKNNYGNVRVRIGGVLVDSGLMFVGLSMGDHSKTGINTMFNTGTIVGVMANVFGSGFQPKFIPSFSWGGVNGMDIYRLEEAIEVAKRVLKRRGKDLTPVQDRLIRDVFELTGQERLISGIDT